MTAMNLSAEEIALVQTMYGWPQRKGELRMPEDQFLAKLGAVLGKCPAKPEWTLEEQSSHMRWVFVAKSRRVRIAEAFAGLWLQAA